MEKLADGILFHQFDNKFRLTIDQIPTVETVTVSVGVGIGSRNETAELNGMSHFLEHMAFKGTKTRTAEQIAREIEHVGGYMNAYTSKDRTVYYIKVLKENVELAIDILADILQNSSFDENELETERGVILQELAASLDTPDDIIFDYFWETAFQNQPIGRPILGPAENIKQFTKSDFQQYINTNYNASNMVLGVAGNINPDEVLKYTAKYFQNLKPATQIKPETAKYKGGELRKDNQELSQVQYILGFRGFDYHDPKRYTANILSNILLGGMSSRLFQEIREKRGLVYTIADVSSMHSDTGLFAIYAGTSPEKLTELTEAICKELKSSIGNFTDLELEKSVNQYKSSILMSQESTTSRSQKMVLNFLAYDRYISSKEILDEVQKVTLKSISDTLNELINRKDITIATYGKIQQMPSIKDIQNMLTA